MPWSSIVTGLFADSESEERESGIQNLPYGPYNRILFTIFPADSEFIVSPILGKGRIVGSADFIISLLQVPPRPSSSWPPVLVLEARPSQDLFFHSRREAADRQMRQHLVDLSGVSSARCALVSLCFLQGVRTSLSSTASVRWGQSSASTSSKRRQGA